MNALGDPRISTVAAARAELWDAGFRPVPVYSFDCRHRWLEPGHAGKRPKGDAWEQAARQDPPRAALAAAEADALETGILCDGLRVLDLDIDDPAIVAQLRAVAVDLLGDTLVRYRENSPRVAMLYRAAQGEPDKRVLAGANGKVEVLGRGQQLVALGKHPSGVELRWMPESPTSAPRETLPEITEEQVTAFFAAAAPLLEVTPEKATASLADTLPHTPSIHGPIADPLDVAAALAVIPNANAPNWEWWNKVGLATWAATGGSKSGFAAWVAWSEKNPAHDFELCRERWNHYPKSPPAQIGAGSLFRMARQARPEWVKPSSATPPADDLILYSSSPLISARQFLLRRHTLDGTRTLLHQNATFYSWEVSHYVECAPEEMRAALYAFLDGARTLNDKDELVPFNPTKSKIANLIEATAAEAQVSRLIRPPAWLSGQSAMPPAEVIACRNGLLHLPTRRMLPHSPDFFTLNALAFDFDPAAPEPREWTKFLKSIWPEDDEAIGTLQEIFGLCLTGDTRHQKAFLIVGPKRSGKGTIARVLTEMLGQSNVCGPTLSSLGQNFGLAPLIGKRLAIVSDARLSGKADQQIIVERLLSVTGEDSLTVDRKFRDAWTGKLDTRFVILTNELPRLTDSSGALAGRFVILTMLHSFYGNEDLGLGARLMQELPGILLWAIAGWERLNARRHFIPPKSSAAAQQELEDLGSPIGAFLKERCIVQPGLGVRCDDLYDAWCVWCRDHGRDHPGTTQTFGRDLGAAVAGLKVERPRADDGTRPRYYSGVTLDPEAVVRDGPRSTALRSQFGSGDTYPDGRDPYH